MQESNRYSLSIVMATKNRPHHVTRGLLSIRKQSIQPLEIIIVDDSDVPALIAENKCLAQQYDCVYLPSPHKGLFANRNLGLTESKGTHIRSMDDDHEYPEGHLEICMQAIEREPETIWTIGEYRADEKIHEAPHPIPGQLHPRGFAYRKFKPNDYYGISDGATIYPRSIIQNNLFNCELYPFGLTYLEYGARLKSRGYILKPLSDTYIIHHNTEQTASKIPDVMIESRIFSTFCLSFKYKKTLYNKALTLFQIVKDFALRKTRLAIIKKAYRNFKLFTR